MKNKSKIILSVLAIVAIFAAALQLSNKKTTVAEEQKSEPQMVSVQKVSDSKNLNQANQFPATVVGDQEIKVTAKAAGVISGANFNIGDKVGAGTSLGRIDDIGNLQVGDQGFRNLQIQQNQLSVEQAKKAYSLAKDVYDNTKNSNSATSTQKDTAKAQVKITKLQYENALLGLTGSVDNHLVTSSIAGTITNKAVANGDSVSVGQELFSVSQSNKIKLQFFVDQKQRAALKVGQEISAIDADGNNLTFVIKNIAIKADETTKRFLVEAYPKTATPLLSGTILTATVQSQKAVEQNNHLFLPLSAVSIGQNESYIFTLENNVAKKISVSVKDVQGENVEIVAELAPETLIIIDGSKLVSDGETVTIK